LEFAEAGERRWLESKPTTRWHPNPLPEGEGIATQERKERFEVLMGGEGAGQLVVNGHGGVATEGVPWWVLTLARHAGLKPLLALDLMMGI
jgi:hypothetical protein